MPTDLKRRSTGYLKDGCPPDCIIYSIWILFIVYEYWLIWVVFIQASLWVLANMGGDIQAPLWVLANIGGFILAPLWVLANMGGYIQAPLWVLANIGGFITAPLWGLANMGGYIQVSLVVFYSEINMLLYAVVIECSLPSETSCLIISQDYFTISDANIAVVVKGRITGKCSAKSYRIPCITPELSDKPEFCTFPKRGLHFSAAPVYLGYLLRYWESFKSVYSCNLKFILRVIHVRLFL